MKIQQLPGYDATSFLPDFEHKHGLEMRVSERNPIDAKRSGRYGAMLEDKVTGYCINWCEGFSSPSVRATTGDGQTPDEAVEAYLKLIDGKLIVPDLADRSKDFWAGTIVHRRAGSPPEMKSRQQVSERADKLTAEKQEIIDKNHRISRISYADRTQDERDFMIGGGDVDRCRALASEINALLWVLGEG